MLEPTHYFHALRHLAMRFATLAGGEILCRCTDVHTGQRLTSSRLLDYPLVKDHRCVGVNINLFVSASVVTNWGTEKIACLLWLSNPLALSSRAQTSCIFPNLL